MRALLAVSDKSGILDFGRGLHELGWAVVATTGTSRALREAGVPATPVSELIDSPEILGGRVKTLHPKVFGGLLYRRGLAEDLAQVEEYGIPAIDLMAGSFYPFSETVSTDGHTLAEALACIDVGGPAMLRAAAKNYRSVIPLVAPGDYPRVLEALRAADGSPEGVSEELRRRLAAKVFELTARYDTAVAEYLRR